MPLKIGKLTTDYHNVCIHIMIIACNYFIVCRYFTLSSIISACKNRTTFLVIFIHFIYLLQHCNSIHVCWLKTTIVIIIIIIIIT